MTEDLDPRTFADEPPAPRATDGFAELHAKWVRCLDAKHRNSIMQQLYEQTQHHAIYRLIVAARRMAPTDPHGTPLTPRHVHSLIDCCYFDSTLAAIRRQLEPHPIDGERGVHSLMTLVLHMQRNRHLFTRANLFSIAGLPMDSEPRRARLLTWLRDPHRDDGAAFLPQGADPGPIDELHRQVDRLTGTSPERRSVSDTISDHIFSSLSLRLEAFSPLKALATKHIAHAATQESINADVSIPEHASLSNIWAAHETLCRTAQLLDCYLLRQTSHHFLPITTGDPLLHLDLPMARPADTRSLRAVWGAYEAETESWGNTTLDWLDEPTPTPSY
jgi:hypothetical protein